MEALNVIIYSFCSIERLKLYMHIFSKISSLVESQMDSFQVGRKKFINKGNLFRSFSFKYIFRRTQSLTCRLTRFLLPV